MTTGATQGDGASCHPPVLLQERNQVSDSPGVEGGGVELVTELDEIALSLALSSASRAFSLFSCYGFAGLRLHPLLVLDLPLLVRDLALLVVFPQLRVLALELLHSLLVLDLSPIELDLSQLVVDNGSPVEQLLRRRLRLRQEAAEPGQ